jgi:hypothetical protein
MGSSWLNTMAGPVNSIPSFPFLRRDRKDDESLQVCDREKKKEETWQTGNFGN